MKFLFVHQNMPGQYRELVSWLAQSGEHQIVFLTQRRNLQLDGVVSWVYQPIHKPSSEAFALSKPWEEASAVGFSVAQEALKLEQQEGFVPDIVIGHTGWGELTFLKDVWPHVPIIGFFEYYYRLTGGIVGFDPEEPINDQAAYFARIRNVVPHLNIETVDQGHCPTYWQRDRFPGSFHDKLYVCHDGIRTDKLLPAPDAAVPLARLGRSLTRDDEVITYVARNLERVRGFHVLMRAIPRILEERPKARIVIVGGEDVSYGRKIGHPKGLRGLLAEELGDRMDWSRVHLLGRVPYSDFCKIIQIGRCHVYMSMPFVLSWSFIEAMSMEATVIGSDTAPVREVVEHGKTGLLVDYFQPDALASQVIDVLSRPGDYAHLGPAARAQTVARYDFTTRCLPEHLSQINALVPKKHALSVRDVA
ncbi:MAG: glycosyltransferase family 4 protein [Pseudomonadota bacterium]